MRWEFSAVGVAALTAQNVRLSSEALEVPRSELGVSTEFRVYRTPGWSLGNFRASGSVRRHCPLPFLLPPLSAKECKKPKPAKKPAGGIEPGTPVLRRRLGGGDPLSSLRYPIVLSYVSDTPNNVGGLCVSVLWLLFAVFFSRCCLFLEVPGGRWHQLVVTLSPAS